MKRKEFIKNAGLVSAAAILNVINTFSIITPAGSNNFSN